MSWDDLILEVPKVQEVRDIKRDIKEEKPKIKVERPKDGEINSLKQRIREQELLIAEQNLQFETLHRIISEKTERIRELEQNSTLSAADQRNLQFLVNCVAKTYQNEFRKNRAPAVKLALVNIIEKFGLDAPEEMN